MISTYDSDVPKKSRVIIVRTINVSKYNKVAQIRDINIPLNKPGVLIPRHIRKYFLNEIRRVKVRSW